MDNDKTRISNFNSSPTPKDNSSRQHTVIGGANQNKSSLNTEERKIVGFLISYSYKATGEYWLLRLGRNLIGKGNDCDIKLSEAKVSERHAILNVRRSQKDGVLMFALKDDNSSNGSFINGEDIEFEPTRCKHGDVLKIGEYELLLLGIDSEQLNLKPSPNFKPTDASSSDMPFDYSARNPNKTRIIK